MHPYFCCFKDRNEQDMVQEVVPLRYDTAFKKAFGQPGIFCQFAQDVLDIEFYTTEVHQGYMVKLKNMVTVHRLGHLSRRVFCVDSCRHPLGATAPVMRVSK